MLTYLRTMALSHGHGERFQLPDPSLLPRAEPSVTGLAALPGWGDQYVQACMYVNVPPDDGALAWTRRKVSAPRPLAAASSRAVRDRARRSPWVGRSIRTGMYVC